jgi:hypothetical protein
VAVAPPPVGDDPAGEHDQVTAVLGAVDYDAAEAVLREIGHRHQL